MIIAPRDGALRLVTQTDHAHFAAELLSLWRADGLAEHPRRSELLFAVREHDNGWAETDSAPWHDPATGRPHDFLSLPHGERRRLWSRGVDRHAEGEPWAALLILEHALELHREDGDGGGPWSELLAQWAARRQHLVEASGASEDEIAADYRWLNLTDLLSLIVCNAWGESFERHGFKTRFAEGVLYLDPFPLAGATTFEIDSRTIPDRPYTSDTDLAVELARARFRPFEIRVVPGPAPAGDSRLG